MVSGGDGLLGTCVGFKGRLAARAGGAVSRAVARPKRRAPTRASLRRPALAVGHGFLTRGWPRGAFFWTAEAVSPKAGARRLDDGAPRACASSPSGGSSKRCVGCFSSGVHLVCDLRRNWLQSLRQARQAQSSGLRPPQASLSLVVDVVLDRPAPRELPRDASASVQGGTSVSVIDKRL